MKIFVTYLIAIFTVSIILNACNSNQTKLEKKVKPKTNDNMTMKNMNHPKDNRISLNLSQQMKQHQLMNMRSHVNAVKSIINLLSTNQFEKASEVAHSKLGLTEEMRKMCTSFKNKEFTNMGLAFHKSADKLGEILKTKNKDKSLQALSTTMNFCVNCHATFRQ